MGNFCGRCGYNFQGQGAKFCPKCGYGTTDFPMENIQQEGMEKITTNRIPKQISDIPTMADLPFISNFNEKIVEVVRAYYGGEDIILYTSGVGVGYGGQGGLGIGMGSAVSTPMKKINDVKMCKLYITDQRLVFIGIDGGLITKEKLGKVHAIIPFENIERTLINKHLFGLGNSYVSISVSTPKGTLEIQVTVWSDEDFQKRPKEQKSIEYWEGVIRRTVQERKQILNSSNKNMKSITSQTDNDPILILKSRLARGEISEEEFVRNKKLLE